MLGLAIITYNRQERLADLIDKVTKFTWSPYRLVVADDGSSDGTRNVCDNLNVTCVTGKNRGISWNKNRGIYALMKLGCDQVILIEDDVTITKPGWDADWISAIKKFGHVNMMTPAMVQEKRERVIRGSGSVNDPFIARFVTGHLNSFSKECIEKVGYFDPLFRGYGYEHIDISKRCGRSGYGFDGEGYIHISTGVDLLAIKPTANKDSLQDNSDVLKSLSADRGYVAPHVTPDELRILEQETAHI